MVQNNEGKFFHRKGYGGGGDTWVEKTDTARVWTKISGARSIVTFFANHYPQYPTPKILKLTVGKTEVLDETERVASVKAKKQKLRDGREVRESKRRLEEAK